MVKLNIVLRVIWLTHFALTSWALMSSYLPVSYYFTHFGVLAFGFWAIVSTKSIGAALMFLITLCFSVVNDVLLISIYQPRAYDNIERPGVIQGIKNEFRWALGMSIVNLLLKPLSIFLVYIMYKVRSDDTASIQGIPCIKILLNTSAPDDTTRDNDSIHVEVQ